VVPSSLRYIGIPNIVYVPLTDTDATTELLLIYRAGEANSRIANLSQLARGKAQTWKEAGQKTRGALPAKPRTRRKPS